MIAKVIKGRDDYVAALAEVERLIDRDPEPETPEGERLNLLTVLVRDYESRTLPSVVSDPVEAIRFRMEQQGLRQRDLVPYIGSKSKVSEVLAGKRSLTLSMIRGLSEGLDIPAEALLAQRDPAMLEPAGFHWERFPLREMVSRGWIRASAKQLASCGEELIRDFLAPIGRPEAALALFRQTGHVRSGRRIDHYALAAWTAQVVRRTEVMSQSESFGPRAITLDVMREVARLSWSEQGPRLAQEFLLKVGIPVIVEPHLPRTHLDGAAIQGPSGPIIGLTIRHDRVDNFWFCLMHELVHVAKHLGPEARRFCDDLDADPGDDIREREADDVASDALIPKEEWNSSPARSLHSPDAVFDLADKLRIHPAIVAGRIRYESGRYRVLSGLVSHGEVRKLFTDVNWK